MYASLAPGLYGAVPWIGPDSILPRERRTGVFLAVGFLRSGTRRAAGRFVLAFFLAADFLRPGFWAALRLTFFAVDFFLLAFFLGAAFLRPTFWAAFRLAFLVAGFFFTDFFFEAAFFFAAGFFFTAAFFFAEAFFFEAGFFLEAGFFFAAAFFLLAGAAFFLVTLRFLAADFLAAAFLAETFLRDAGAFFRFLLAVFFAGIFYSCRTEKRRGLYIDVASMEPLF